MNTVWDQFHEPLFIYQIVRINITHILQHLFRCYTVTIYLAWQSLYLIVYGLQTLQTKNEWEILSIYISWFYHFYTWQWQWRRESWHFSILYPVSYWNHIILSESWILPIWEKERTSWGWAGPSSALAGAWI